MVMNFLRRPFRNPRESVQPSRQEDELVVSDPFTHKEQTEPPTLTELVHEADEKGKLAKALPKLPPAVADALRAIASGERVPALLDPQDLTELGQAVAVWGIPYYRGQLEPWSPPVAAPQLAEHLSLPLETAQRIAAVADWPIGFLAEDFRDFAALTDEETMQAMDYLAKVYGSYATGLRYAAP